MDFEEECELFHYHGGDHHEHEGDHAHEPSEEDTADGPEEEHKHGDDHEVTVV